MRIFFKAAGSSNQPESLVDDSLALCLVRRLNCWLDALEHPRVMARYINDNKDQVSWRALHAKSLVFECVPDSIHFVRFIVGLSMHCNAMW